ncbi:MAG: PilZ domain-containing protein [Sphingobacterium sp.]|nr:PilZ domain-containing protein [Sphingobacterium sp.]
MAAFMGRRPRDSTSAPARGRQRPPRPGRGGEITASIHPSGAIAPAPAPGPTMAAGRGAGPRGAGHVRTTQEKPVQRTERRPHPDVGRQVPGRRHRRPHVRPVHGRRAIVTSKSYTVGTIMRVRLDLAGTDQFVNLDGEVKWVKARPNEDVYEIGAEFQRLTSQAVLSLIRHLYGRQNGIPSMVA